MLGNGSGCITHKGDDDKRKRRPGCPAGKKVEQGHSDAAGNGSAFLPENNGTDKKRHISKMNQAAGCRYGKADIYKSGKYISQRSENSGNGKKPCMGKAVQAV